MSIIESAVANEFMWEQKYRPQKLADCILPEQDRSRFAGVVKQGRIPHILLCSKSPGTGKTTMAHVLCNEIDAEVYFITGGNMRIDTLRTELTQFARTTTQKPGGKVIIIDEADNTGMRAVHAELRSWMEAFSHNCSVIMTCNNIEVIPSPLRSRCRVIEFGSATDADKTRMLKEMIVRCKEICQNEGVTIDPDTGLKALAALAKKNFPDIRKTITELDSYAVTGTIDEGVLTQTTKATENMKELISSMRNKKLGDVRALVPKFTADYSSFITTLYAELFKEVNPKSIRTLVALIADNQKYATTVSNLEIHLFDLLINLACELEWK